MSSNSYSSEDAEPSQAPPNTLAIMSSIPPAPQFPQETSFSNANEFISGVLNNIQTKDMLPGFARQSLIDQRKKKTSLSADSAPFVPAATNEVPSPQMDQPLAVPKTVYIPQQNKNYDQKDELLKKLNYRSSYEKMWREVNYFHKILEIIEGDFRETEEDIAESVLLKKRQIMKKHFEKLKTRIDDFIVTNLEGEIRQKTQRKPSKEETEELEYTHPYDKKPDTTTNSEQIHKCIDCEVTVVIDQGKTLDEAFSDHAQSAHPSLLKAEEIEVLKPDKKKDRDRDRAFAKHCQIHRITSNSDKPDLMFCQPCNMSFLDRNSTEDHMNSPEHCNTLHEFHKVEQYVIMEQNPQLFGAEMPFQLTNEHINVHKMFIDPSQKLIYCGVCRKRLPFSPNHIDIHIKSPKHYTQLYPEDNYSSPINPIEINLKNIPKTLNEQFSMMAIYDDHYECLVCKDHVLTNEQEVEDHLRSVQHEDTLQAAKDAYFQGRRDKKGRKVKINMNKNGNGSFWCPTCRMALPNIRAVFEHPEQAGHLIDCIVGVWISEKEHYFCQHCNITFIGEKNALTHIKIHGEAEKEMLQQEKMVKAPVKKSVAPITNWRQKAPLEPAVLKTNFVVGTAEQYSCVACGVGPMSDNETEFHLKSPTHKSRLSHLVN